MVFGIRSILKVMGAVLTDMATSLKGMGFTTVILMGDSGGNQTPMKEVGPRSTPSTRRWGCRRP
ncbi:MAG: hypothetical protein Q8O42_06840 [Acidobacteriota bacterium]|nr:hypothetical protein [Acidobacteriota bacterium]